MVGPGNRVLRVLDIRYHLAGVPGLGAAQQREIQLRDGHEPDFVPTLARALGIGIGQRMAEMVLAAVGMTLDDNDVSWHGTRSERLIGAVKQRPGRKSRLRVIADIFAFMGLGIPASAFGNRNAG